MISLRNIKKFLEDRKDKILLAQRTNILRRARRKSIDGLLLTNASNRVMRQFPEFFEVVMTSVERAEPGRVRIAMEDSELRNSIFPHKSV